MRIIKGSEVKPKLYDFWQGVIPKGCVTLLAGEGGSGKTTLACYFAETISRNAKVLFAEYEEDENYLKSRFDYYTKVDFAVADENTPLPTTEEIVELLQDYDIIFVDNLRTLAGGKNINKAEKALEVLSPLTNAVKGTEKSIVLLAHTNKGMGDTLKDAVAGSAALVDLVRHCKIVVKDELEGRRFLAVAKDNTNCDSTPYEIIANDKEIEGQAGYIKVVTKLIPTTVDLDEIIIRNSRKFKREMMLKRKQNKPLRELSYEDVPKAIKEVLLASEGEDVTSIFVENHSNIQSWQSALRKTGTRWITKTKNGRQVTYHWTDEALEWLREQDEDYPF